MTLQLDMPEPLLARLDAWRASQPHPLSRAEAARCLIDLGLEHAEEAGPGKATDAAGTPHQTVGPEDENRGGPQAPQDGSHSSITEE